jgi:hypothetical protein
MKVMRDLNPEYGRSLTSLRSLASPISRDGTPFQLFARPSCASPSASSGREVDTAWASPPESRKAKRRERQSERESGRTP